MEADPHVRQHPIEMILLRQVAARLAFPVFLVTADEMVVYRNPAANALFGFSPGDLPDEVPLAELAACYRPTDENGAPVPTDQIPVGIALRERRPCQARLWVHDRAGGAHRLTVTAFPLEGQGGVRLGAMSIFWETEDW